VIGLKLKELEMHYHFLDFSAANLSLSADEFNMLLSGLQWLSTSTHMTGIHRSSG